MLLTCGLAVLYHQTVEGTWHKLYLLLPNPWWKDAQRGDREEGQTEDCVGNTWFSSLCVRASAEPQHKLTKQTNSSTRSILKLKALYILNAFK